MMLMLLVQRLHFENHWPRRNRNSDLGNLGIEWNTVTFGKIFVGVSFGAF